MKINILTKNQTRVIIKQELEKIKESLFDELNKLRIKVVDLERIIENGNKFIL